MRSTSRIGQSHSHPFLERRDQGLKEWPADQRPPVAAPFFTFRIMVGAGVIMLIVAVVGQFLRLRGRLWESRWFLRLCPWVAPLGFIAVIAGWTTTEVGRQPWTVYGLLRTADFGIALAHRSGRGLVTCPLHRRLSDHVPDRDCVHAVLVRRGPQEQEPEMIESGRPNRPFENAARAAADL